MPGLLSRISFSRTAISAISACTVLSLLSFAPPAHAFTTPDTPIKVGGGSMTFFSSAKWKASGQGWCTDLTSNDISTIQLDRFFDGKHKRVDFPIPSAGMFWSLTIQGHDANETTQLIVGPNGVTMTASPADCSGGNTGPSVTITPIAQGDLQTYKAELVTTAVHKGNKRYADTTCSNNDRDRCERMAQVTVSGTNTIYDNTSYTCPDGECRLYIGTINHGVHRRRAIRRKPRP